MGAEDGSDAEDSQFRLFVGGLSWGTDENTLLDAFQQYGAVDTKIVMDRDSGRSRGFGFVTFSDKKSMEDALDEMHNKELDGRNITVSVAQGRNSGGGDRSYGGRGGRGSFGGRGGGGGGECFKCGRSGHWARECPEGGGDGYGDRRGGGRGYGGDRRSGGYSSRSGGYGDRDSDSYGGSDRYGSSDRGDRYGSGGRSSSGRDRTRSAPYDRPKEGSSREDRY